MKLRFIWAGASDPELSEVTERYLKRIKHFFPIEVVQVSPERNRQKLDDLAIIRAQSARLLASIPDKGFTVVLDERGEVFESVKFAKWLEKLTITSPHGINLVMGGDVGLDDSVRKRADKLVSLSAMTLPHGLARVVLVEQIYRACTLMRNISYHK